MALTEAPAERLSALLEVKNEEGGSIYIPVSEMVRSPRTLNALLPLVVAVIDPYQVAERLIDAAPAALTTLEDE